MAFTSCEQAMKWLKSIGGRIDGPRRKTEDWDGVTVFVPGHRMSRTEHFDKVLTGVARQRAVDDAIRRACEQFRDAGADGLAGRA